MTSKNSPPYLGGVILLLIILLSSCNTKKSTTHKIRLAIIDTGICFNKIKTSYTFNFIQTDLTNSNPNLCQDFSQSSRRFHGHNVLQNFLNQLKIPTSRLIEIHSLVIFNKKGKQKISYWKKAADYIEKENINFVIVATGYPLKKDATFPIWKPLSFLSSGQTAIGINKDSKLYPQLSKEKMNSYIIGSYHPPVSTLDATFLYNHSLLNKEHIDYYFSGGHSNAFLKDSSLAVSSAAAIALNLCSKSINSKKEFKNCLLQYRRPLAFPLDQVEGSTFMSASAPQN